MAQRARPTGPWRPCEASSWTSRAGPRSGSRRASSSARCSTRRSWRRGTAERAMRTGRWRSG
eukprot:4098613-Alexandrium_andersonii.AAC.1